MAAPRTTSELARIYKRSFENMRDWLRDSSMRADERLGIIDAWQEELRVFYRENGHCFACDRRLEQCLCAEPLDESVH